MQPYQFEKIYSQMEQEFGKIKRGEEDQFNLLFFPLESNALKIHRMNHASNSRRMREAIALVLFDVKEKVMEKRFDTKAFRNAENERLEKALLYAMDPFTNEDIMQAVKEIYSCEEPTPQILKQYYKAPVMCLLKIKESIDLWEKRSGSNGYFDFLESFMGHLVKYDDKMEFTVLAEKK